jgi:hypothetical protein
MRKIALFVFALIAFFSCQKQTEWQLKNGNYDFIVVDGMLTDEAKSHIIKISRPTPNINETSEAVSNATVTLSDGDSIYTLVEQPANSGLYRTKSNFAAKSENAYTLNILAGGKTYSAKTTMATGSYFKTLRYTKNNDDNLYKITWVANAYNPQKPAMYEILIDWSAVQGYEILNAELCKAKLYYYSLPSIDVTQIFAPELEKVSFPAGTIITERKYSLTSEHASFCRALLLETSWKGGLFDSAPANLPTNLSNGAIGFFSVCSVTSVSIIVS